MRVRHLVAGHQVWTERSASVEILAQEKHAFFHLVELYVPNADVIEDRVSNDRVQGFSPADRPTWFADYECQFPLVVQLPAGPLWVVDRRLVPDQDGRELCECDWMLWRTYDLVGLRFSRMTSIVDAGTNDLAGARHDGEKADGGGLEDQSLLREFFD